MKVNDKVVCLNPISGKIIKDKIYHVRAISHDSNGIKLDEIPDEMMNPYHSGYFLGSRFRKLSPPMTNSVTRELVKELTENDKLRQIEKEKLFTTKADF